MAEGENPSEGEKRGPTTRELEVLRLLATGYTGTEAARELTLSPDTVRNHARSAREKLGARTRAQAIAIAVDRGLIEL